MSQDRTPDPTEQVSCANCKREAKPIPIASATGIEGVFRKRPDGRWYCQLCLATAATRLGETTTAAPAAAAYDKESLAAEMALARHPGWDETLASENARLAMMPPILIDDTLEPIRPMLREVERLQSLYRLPDNPIPPQFRPRPSSNAARPAPPATPQAQAAPPTPVAHPAAPARTCPPKCRFAPNLSAALHTWEAVPAHRDAIAPALEIARKLLLSESQFRRLRAEHRLPEWRALTKRWAMERCALFCAVNCAVNCAVCADTAKPEGSA